MKNLTRSIILGCSPLALAACGADDVVAPGGPIIVPTPTPSGSPSPTPTPGSVAAAASCTAGTTDGGVITLQNNRGTIRNCVIPNQINGTLTLGGRRADGIMYSLNGRTDVGRDVALANGQAATLVVLPGVTVFGASRDSNLVVNRGSRIEADGTEAQPIIFTALANLTGQGLTHASDNLWGGIIINGRAPVSDCDTDDSTDLTGGSAGCWREAEGVAVKTLFGGNLANDSSGVLRYVQVNFTGVGANASEIQGITTGGVGSGTVMSHIQIHNSKDDGIESFGGRQNMSHLVFTGVSDDSLDTDNGYQGAIQFVLAVSRSVADGGTAGDTTADAETLLEVDSSGVNDALPRQKLKLANFTFIHNRVGGTVMRLRGGADIQLLNGIVVGAANGTAGCVDVDNAETVQTTGPDEDGPPVLKSVVFQCAILSDPDSDTFEATMFANAANVGVNQSFTNTLQTLTGLTVGRIANGANETGVAAVASIGSISAFFQQVNYIGALSGPNDTWTRNWTCNSDVANLGGATACTDIRIS